MAHLKRVINFALFFMPAFNAATISCSFSSPCSIEFVIRLYCVLGFVIRLVYCAEFQRIENPYTQ